MIIEYPFFANFRKVIKSFFDSSGVSTAVGSSRIKVLAPRDSALSISTLCCSPILNCSIYESTETLKSYLLIKSLALIRSFLFVIKRGVLSHPKCKFSATVKVLTRRKCW